MNIFLEALLCFYASYLPFLPYLAFPTIGVASGRLFVYFCGF